MVGCSYSSPYEGGGGCSLYSQSHYGGSHTGIIRSLDIVPSVFVQWEYLYCDKFLLYQMTLDFIYHYNLKDAIGESHNGTYNEKSDNCSYYMHLYLVTCLRYHLDIIKVQMQLIWKIFKIICPKFLLCHVW